MDVRSLESKNARLNIAKLGAVCNTYIRDYYGTLRDDLNRGLATDRFQVDWWIASRRIETRLTRNRPPLQLHHYLDVGTPIINAAQWNERDLPVCQDPIEPPPSDRFLVEFRRTFKRSGALITRWHCPAAAFAIDLRGRLFVRLHGDRLRARAWPARAVSM
jgi:hypothetical protein